jgi:hypothetical protein
LIIQQFRFIPIGGSEAMSTVIDWSKYGRAKREKPSWSVTYEDDGHGDCISITAVFQARDLDGVVASIRRQLEYWANEPKPPAL